MKAVLLTISTLLALAFSCRCLAEDSSAADDTSSQSVSVELHSSKEIVAAYGLFIQRSSAIDAPLVPTGQSAQSASGARRKVVVRHQEDDRWIAVVALEPEDRENEGQLTVVAKTKDGDVLSSPVVSLAPAKTEPPGELSCTPPDDAQRIGRMLSLDKKNLEELIATRQKKVELLQGLVRRELQPNKLATLTTLEKRLRIPRPTPFTRQMSLDELANRLGAIQALNPFSPSYQLE